MIPETTHEAILEAFTRFDQEYRNSSEWSGWEQAPSYKFAIEYQGRRYPVKQIIAMATGTSRQGFSGGYEANNYVKRLGFLVVSLRSDIQPNIWWVNQGDTYQQGRNGGYIWAPLTDKRGAALIHWGSLTEVEEDDLIIHYSDNYVRAISRAKGKAYPAEYPEDSPNQAWSKEGRRIDVEYFDLDPLIARQTIGERLRALEIPQGPITVEGGVKQGYLWRFNQAGLQILQEQSSSEWPEWAKLPPLEASSHSAWIFQSNPQIFNLPSALQFLTQIHWLVKQHTQRIHPGDTVFFWESGNNAGILATGTVLTEPQNIEEPEGENLFNVSQDKLLGAQLRVLVKFDQILSPRISKQTLVNHPVLKDLSILRFYQATNFEVTPEQAQTLRVLIQAQQTKEPPMALDRLLQYLAQQRLFFSAEVISNYVLALQTKRFVILTGISGTGKTQLAIGVAKHFQPRITVAEVTQKPADAVAIEVFPYMLKHHRMVLPAAVAESMVLPPVDAQTNGGQILVSYPEGKATLSFRKDPTRNVIQLFFKGPFRQWFGTSLMPGKQFLLEAVETSDGNPHELRFSLANTEERRVPLANYRVIAVRPDWTDNRSLLGYYNPLTNHYSITPFLQLLLDARTEVKRAEREGRDPHPFFVILDEMNLARVEYYFSDFLSCLESGEELELHNDPLVQEGESAEAVSVPPRLPIPSNVFFTGTVNIDETTHMFSPKVLDRAFTIELNQVDLSSLSFVAPLNGATPFSLRRFTGTLGVALKPDAADWEAFGAYLEGRLRQKVIAFHELLEKEHRHFGYRVANEISRFVRLAAEQAGDNPEILWAALDLALLEKVLPKFHGTQQEFGNLLTAVLAFAIFGEQPVVANIADHLEEWDLRRGQLERIASMHTTLPIMPQFPRTAAKVWRMLRRLQEQGFTSFIE